MLFNLEV